MTIICHEKYKKDYNCKIKYINEILRIALTNNLSPTSYSLVRNAYFPPPAWSLVNSTEDFVTGNDRLKSSEKFQGYDLPGGPSFAQINQTAVCHL